MVLIYGYTIEMVLHMLQASGLAVPAAPVLENQSRKSDSSLWFGEEDVQDALLFIADVWPLKPGQSKLTAALKDANVQSD